MRKIESVKIAILAVFCVLLFGEIVSAQKRRPARGSKSAATKTTATAANAAAAKDGAQLVANQIKNLGQFVFLYGGSLTRIEVVDQEAKLGRTSSEIKLQSDAGKKGLVLTVRTFKNAMLDLEDKFRTNPALRPYLLQITGVGEIATTAEEQAAAGQFAQAGRTLLEVLNQLTDTLQAMP